MFERVRAGMRVRVSFGSRMLIGLVTGIETLDHAEPSLKLIEELLDDAPVLADPMLELGHFISQYYLQPLGEVLFHMLPSLLRQGQSSHRPTQSLWHPTALAHLSSAHDLRRAPRQRRALQILLEFPAGLSRQVAQLHGITVADLDNLVRRELAARTESHESLHEGASLLAEVPLTPSDEQAQAIACVRSQQGFGCHVLEGITGSGKTEVYLHLIADVLARGQQALVLVPEINLTPQTLQRFQQRFHVPMISLHSELGDRERLRAWHLIRSGQMRLIVGTRSALFCPMLNPGLMILDEEHDGSFKQQEGVRYHARDLAVYLARRQGIPIILGSATPSLETLNNALQGRYTHLQLHRRSNRSTPAQIIVQDIRGQELQAGLSSTSLVRIQEHLQRKQQVLVFLNRRGYATSVLCHDCGWRVHCPHCSVYPTLHQGIGRMLCHHCGWNCAVPQSCPDCNSTRLMATGTGTERLEQLLQSVAGTCPIWRMDRDSIPNHRVLEHTLAEIHQNQPGILIGTQMLVKGHHFHAVSLVVVVDTDAGLFSADFRSPERSLQRIHQVAGRSGRSTIQGQVILQTHDPEHPLLQCLIRSGYHAVAQIMLQERHQLNLPPYSYQALVHCQGRSSAEVQQFLLEIHTIFRLISPYGPVCAPIEKKAGVFRAHLLLQANGRPALHQQMANLPAVCKDKARHGIRWWIDVDPQDLL